MPLRSLPDGTVRSVPPPTCPACHIPWHTPVTKPRMRPLGCICPAGEAYHTGWLCQCGALTAENCQNVTLWVQTYVPIDAQPDQRFTWP